MKIIKRLFKINIIILIIGIISLGSVYLAAYLSPVLDIKTTGQFYIYDNKDNIVYQGSGTNKWVVLDDISSNFIDAIISIEDKNFYKHNGFDYLRIIKAMITNIKSNEIVGGASTISQQYIKNLYLDFDKNWEENLRKHG